MYVIYNMNSKRIMSDKQYAYKAVALRHADKIEKRFGCYCSVMLEVDYYKSYGNLTKKVTNLMSGVEIEIGINTPMSCDPSSELHWSM